MLGVAGPAFEGRGEVPLTKRLAAVLLALALLLGLVAAIAVGCGSSSASNLPTGIMAKVGQVSITQDQFNHGWQTSRPSTPGSSPTRPAIPAEYKDFERSVLDYMVTYELVKQQSAALKISVTDAGCPGPDRPDQDREFRRRSDQVRCRAQGAGHHYGPAEDKHRESLLMQKAYDEVTKSLTDANVTQAEIQSYYDANKSSFYTAETRDGGISSSPRSTHHDNYGRGFDDQFLRHHHDGRAYRCPVGGSSGHRSESPGRPSSWSRLEDRGRQVFRRHRYQGQSAANWAR